MTNIFAKMDAYWDSPQSWIDEYREESTEKLEGLLDINVQCLRKIEEDPTGYWEWRNSQQWARPIPTERQRPLETVKAVCLRAVEASTFVLEERRK